MKKNPQSVSLADIARAAGVSKACVSYALQNRPGAGKATKERVLRVAEKLGYVPDPRVASWLAMVRGAGSRDSLPIAWLNTTKSQPTWRKFKYLSPYIEGAQARTAALGYRLEEIWTEQPGMTMRRVAQILDSRGIEGVIVTYPARHLRLNWDRVAAVSLEGALLAPHLHHVGTDRFYNLLLALKVVKRAGYRRIGICLDDNVDRYSGRSLRAAAHYFHDTLPKAQSVRPLFYSTGGAGPRRPTIRKQVQAWLRRERPDVVVAGAGLVLEIIEAAGYRVPRDIGVVHLATDDDVSDWAGIDSNKRAIGAAAAETVISLMQRRQFGLPQTTLNTVVRGFWHPGRTLLIPKPSWTGRLPPEKPRRDGLAEPAVSRQ